MTLNEFLAAVQAIADSKPSYRLGGSGDDGTCDCIGLIIGAVERNGVKCSGIHGTNWWGRNYTTGLTRVTSADALALGDIVYKAHSPGDSGYALPDRYSDHFDDKDYYHVGVVTQVNPLRITHCTTPKGIRTATRMGSWRWRGRLSLLDETPSPAAPVTLRRGSRGDDVVMLQQLLRQAGYTLKPDGIFGPLTRSALISYQATRGLEADGIAGPLTWAQLMKEKEACTVWNPSGNT